MTSRRENTDPQRGCNKRPSLLGSLSASVFLTLFPPTDLGHFFPPCNWNSLLDHCTKWPLLVFSAPLQRKSYKMSFNFKFPGMSQIDPVGDVIFGPFGQPGRFMLQEYGFYNIWNGDCDGFKTRKSFCGPLLQGFDLLSSSDILLVFFDPGSHNIHPNWSQTHYVAQSGLTHGNFLTLSLTCIITNIYHHAQQWQLLHDHFITIYLSHSNALNISP